MTGVDFLSLAKELCARTDEAALRTSIGRAYYGAFHVARDFVAGCGVVMPRSESEHSKLPQCLIHCGQLAASEAGRLLDELRGDRNRADYRLEVRTFSRQASAASCVAHGLRVVELLAECDSDAVRDKVRFGIRKYADEILRWQLVS